jgi:hypothetical protein
VPVIDGAERRRRKKRERGGNGSDKQERLGGHKCFHTASLPTLGNTYEQRTWTYPAGDQGPLRS